jgi:hypothetical protein
MSLGVIRPDGWDFALLVHVGGAMILVGCLAVVLTCLVLGRGGGGAAITRLGYRTLLLGALPGFVLMRAGAEWIKSKEDVPDDPSWIGIGYSTSDGGLVLLIVVTVLAGLAVRRLRREGGRSPGLVTAATLLLALSIAGYALAIWAMTTKPD